MNLDTKNGPRFPTGRLVITSAAQVALDAVGISGASLLARHVHGDWGALSESDRQQNELAAQSGQRILSSYVLPGGQAVWVITEWDRSITTFLLPSDY